MIIIFNLSRVAYSIFIVLTTIIFFSCKENGIQSQIPQAELHKTNEMVIERDTRFIILDHHLEKNVFLAYDAITKSFIRIDGKGKVIDEIERAGEGPNEYFTNILSAAFNERGDGFFLQSSNELLWYNENWEVINRWRFSSFFNIIFYGGPKIKTPYFFLNGATYPQVLPSFYSNIKIPIADVDPSISSQNLLEVFDPSDGSLTWKLPIQFGFFSPYKPADKEFDLTQVYFLDDNQKLLHLTFDNSLTIGIYDLTKNFELVKYVQIVEQSLEDKGKGKTVSLFPADESGYILLRYSGISEVELEKKKVNNEYYFPLTDPTLYKFYFLDKGHLVSPPISFPENFDPNAEIILLENGKILMREKDKDDEESTYSKYAVFEFRLN
ncbi:hypothetical protein BC751_1354 [Cecembia calidifontis]|uniref:TolB-like protein n=1 Tax=Cecembia calidifontis TaxID=1187080 RepID=A0A4Q7P8K5_9BACT|nr:hypothetical protein BC751_1354 [Cecembia calidifontis]